MRCRDVVVEMLLNVAGICSDDQFQSGLLHRRHGAELI